MFGESSRQEDKREEEEQENIDTNIHKIDLYSEIKDLEACIDIFSIQDKEQLGISANNDEDQVNATSSRSRWDTTWNPAPDRRDLMKSKYHKDRSVNSTYSWNIDNCTKAEVMSVLHSMLVCYRTYLVDNIGPINATRRIIGGFEGTLDSWLKVETLKVPNLLPSWEQAMVLNEDGTRYMDPVTRMPINNMIGKLIYGITMNFIVFPQITNGITIMTLITMRLHNMQHFGEYFNEFLHRLHTLTPDLNLEPKWKEIFVASLPQWVSSAIVNKLPGKIGDYKFGIIKQVVQKIIVELCSQMKIARAASNPKKPHGYQQICKQLHLGKDGNSLGKKKRTHRYAKKNCMSSQIKEKKHLKIKPYKHT